MTTFASLVCEKFGACRVVQLRGLEGMNTLPEWTAEVLSGDADVDLTALELAPARLALPDDGEGATREIALVVVHAAYLGPYRGEHRYTLEMSSEAWPLGLRRGYRIFQKQTSQEIVAEVLRDAGIPDTHVSWRLAARYARRVQCVQYDENEWAFIERLLAEEGISYWFDAHDGSPLLVFGDGPEAHDGILGELRVPFVDPSGMAGSAPAFFALARAEELAHDAVHVRDYDARHPDVPIEGRAGEGACEWFEFPACVLHEQAATARAAVRLEQLQRLAVSAEGESGCARLQPGRVARIVGAADAEFSGEWLIVRVEHALDQAANNTAAARPYRNRVLLVPRSVDGKDRVFRPGPPASRPRVDGIETAFVTGPRGEEIHVDDLGSVKLSLPWDPSGVRDDTSSRWARTLQMNMDSSMLLPRVGWEVAVGYADGNPDEPLVLGQVHNGERPPPYAMPAMKATSTLRSNTSPHDGSSNEIRFGDTAGSQEMFVHASNTQSVSVGASATTKVGANETHDVKGGYGVHVGSQAVTVGATQKVDVGADMETLVKGARTEVVGAVEDIGVKANRLVKVGSYSEVIGALYGLQCNEALTMVQGAYAELVGGNLAAVAGLGTHESVADMRIEVVAGARNVVAGKGYEESVLGAKAVSAGAVRESAARNVAVSAAGGRIKVGGSATLSAGGKLQIDGGAITIKVGGNMSVSGGATAKIGGKLKVDGGTTKIDATTTARKSGSKVRS
jgi:type VI secretion system secreted protein VgrG